MAVLKLKLACRLLLLLLLISCKSNEKYKNELSSANPPTTIMKAAYKLGESGDTSAIKPLLANILDPRMSTNLRFKGMTVCYCKLTALKKISGIAPAWEIDQFGQDTAAAQFYLDWAIKKRVINSMNDIDITYSN